MHGPENSDKIFCVYIKNMLTAAREKWVSCEWFFGWLKYLFLEVI